MLDRLLQDQVRRLLQLHREGRVQHVGRSHSQMDVTRRIAHVLSTIQRAIAAQDDLITTAREVKRSLMQRLFTYGRSRRITTITTLR